MDAETYPADGHSVAPVFVTGAKQQGIVSPAVVCNRLSWMSISVAPSGITAVLRISQLLCVHIGNKRRQEHGQRQTEVFPYRFFLLFQFLFKKRAAFCDGVHILLHVISLDVGCAGNDEQFLVYRARSLAKASSDM